jgi:predicted O-methyltransferase YrrM
MGFQSTQPLRSDQMRLSLGSAHISFVQYIENWLLVESTWALSRINPELVPRIVLRFRDGSESLACPDVHSLEFCLGALHGAASLGMEDPITEVRVLNSIAQTLRRDLQDHFTDDEIASIRGGGTLPTLKDSLLWLLVRRLCPSTVIETGVAQGVSSSFILDALDRNGAGSLISIDYPDAMAVGEGKVALSSLEKFGPTTLRDDLGPGWIVPERLRDHWRVILGPAQEVLPTLSGSFDMFFHDSLHTYEHMMFEYTWFDAHSTVGAVLVSDDISWNPSFQDFLQKVGSRWIAVSRTRTGVALKSR